MEKVLMLASVASMIDQFNMSNIKILLDMGYEVHVACNMKKGSTCSSNKINELKMELDKLGVKYYHIDFTRSIFNIFEDMKAYNQVKRLVDKYHYKFVHCHSPIGGVIGRLVCRNTKVKCIYTAHGFHFFKGGPISSWILFYPVEKFLSCYTDVLITINEEDFCLAKKKFCAVKVVKIPGVGVDVNKFVQCSIDREEYRKRLGIMKDDVMVFSVGELRDIKNHSVIIKAISKLNNKKIKYCIAGQGDYKEKLEGLIKQLKMEEQVKLLGYRKDIPSLCKSADIFAFPSKREGLGLAAIEAMATGLPLITSNVSGIKDYSKDGVTGYSFKPNDVNGFARAIKLCICDEVLVNSMKENNIKISKKYDISNVNRIMKGIYDSMSLSS